MSENAVEYCLNCKHEIPAGNFQMHMIHCKRNLLLCSVCDERVLRSELESHTKEFHSVISCKECNAEFQSSELNKHKMETCSKRIVPCQYCELELRADDIGEHEDYCGSRTECCEGCGKNIMIKFQHLHLDSNHRIARLNEVLSTDSDDEDVVTMDEDRNYGSPRYKRRSTRQRHLRFPNAGPSANGTTPSRLNGHKQKKIKSHSYEETSELNEYFRHMDLENGQITNGTTAEINEIINRERSSPDISHTWLRDTLIPCEFCKVPIMADNLVLHQTGCRPDLSSVQFSSEPLQSYVGNLQRERQEYGETNPDSDDDIEFMREVLAADQVIIPCEFCLVHFSLDDISSHQYVCRRNNFVH